MMLLTGLLKKKSEASAAPTIGFWRMKTSGVFPAVVLLLGVTWSYFSHGLSQPLSFTLERMNPISMGWNETKIVEAGDTIRLTCSTTSGNSSLLQIRRKNQSATLVAKNDTTVNHTVKRLRCEDMDSYICESEQGQNMENTRIDLGVYKCPPRPCNGESPRRIIYAEVGETKMLSLCVIVYPKIGEYAWLHDTEIRGNTHYADDIWTWAFERKGFDRFMISVTIRNITNYGEIPFGVSSSQTDSVRDRLEYSLVLRKPGPPECPSDITVTSRSGSQDVQLAWLPGSDRGATQWFKVYYSRDKGSDRWEAYGDKVRETTLNVRDLEQNTIFYFRVIALNKYLNESNSNHDHCKITAQGLTGAFAREITVGPGNGMAQKVFEDNSNCAVLYIIVSVMVLELIANLAIIIGIFVYLRLIRTAMLKETRQ